MWQILKSVEYMWRVYCALYYFFLLLYKLKIFQNKTFIAFVSTGMNIRRSGLLDKTVPLALWTKWIISLSFSVRWSFGTTGYLGFLPSPKVSFYEKSTFHNTEKPNPNRKLITSRAHRVKNTLFFFLIILMSTSQNTWSFKIFDLSPFYPLW